jgi:hypothetical protein
MPQDRSTERNKKYEGKHSGENKRKMAREEDALKIAT